MAGVVAPAGPIAGQCGQGWLSDGGGAKVSPMGTGPALRIDIGRRAHEHRFIRTTLDIADDVLQAARERARREGKKVGDVISELARAALGTAVESSRPKFSGAVFGFRPFPKRGGVVTNELIDRLRQGGDY